MRAILQVHDLRARYAKGGDEVLKGIDLELYGDEFVAIIGASGAGKSTFIRCINRLVEPSGGRILLEGADIVRLSSKGLRKVRRSMGMIFQEFNLVERMTVMDNVLSGRLGYTGTIRSIVGWFRREDIEAAIELLEKVGLGDFLDKRVDQLSGGQRQRVGIARALIQKPKLLLVDEPTSSLDPKIARDVMGLIRAMSHEVGVPTLCNIHDVNLAKEFASRVIALRDGVKMYDGEPSGVTVDFLTELYAGEVL